MRSKLQLLLTLLLALPIGMLAAGTTWKDAMQLPLGQQQKGSLSNDRTEEFWKFTVNQDGSAKMIITPGDGLRIDDFRLYYIQSDGNNYWERSSNTYHINPSWYKSDFTTPDLAPGTYLLKVHRGEGEAYYNIKVEFTPNYYTNNTETDGWDPRSDEKPNTLPLNKTVKGHLGYGYENGSEDKVDWWTFTVTEDGVANINIKPEGSLRIEDLRLYFYQSDGNNYWQRTDHNYFIDPSWYEGNLTIPNLAPGTYLIKLSRGEGYGGYELKYTFKGSTYANNDEVDGWDPRSDNKPNTLPLNTPVQGHLGYGYEKGSEDNVDWWLFEATQDGTVNINIQPETSSLRVEDLRLYFYQSDGNNYWQRTDNNYFINPSWYEGNLTIPNMAPGKYLVNVSRGEGYGGYKLTYTMTPQEYENDPEPNNEWRDGLANNYLARGQEKQAHLGYGYENSSEDDTDWYRITVPRDGQVNIIYTPTNINSVLRVDDIRFYFIQSDGNNIWERTSNTYYIDPGWYAGTLSVPDVAPGDYMVRVHRGEGYGAYSLKYEFVQNPLPDDGQTENNWRKPTKLAEGKTLSGHLGYGYANGNEDDEDWYEVTMTKAGKLTINVQPGENLRIDDVRLYYYQADRNNIWERTEGTYYINPGWYHGSLVTEDVKPGDYVLKIHRGEGYGNYRIAFNADITDVEQLKPLPDEGVTETDTKPGTDWNNGGSLAPNSSTDKHMNSDSPTHWYSFTVTEDGQADITLALRNNLDISGWWVYARKDNGDMELRGAIDLGTNETGTMTIKDLAPGKYYIKIQHFSGDGDYTLTGRFTPCSLGNDVENNDTWQKAQTIKPGQSLTGHMGYCYVSDDRDTDDWYKVEVPYDGIVTLTLKPQAELDFYAIEFGFHNTEVNGISRQGNGADEGAAGLTVTLKQVNVAAGTYYLHIPHCPGGQGGYTLSYDLTRNPYGNDVEPNDTWQQAKTTIAKGSTFTGHLGYVKYNVTDEHDWYMVKLDARSGIDVTIQLSQELDLYGMTLYSLSGGEIQSVESVDPYYGETKTLSVNGLQAGTYYIDVHYCAGQGHYWLSFDSAIGTPENPIDPKPIDPTSEEPTTDNPIPGGVTIDEFTCWFYDVFNNVMTMGFKLSEHPQVQFTPYGIQVKTTKNGYLFTTSSVVKFTLNGVDSAVGIEEVVAPVQPAAEGSISRQGEDLLWLSGFKPGQLVEVYTVGGRLVEQYRTDSGGSLEISLGSLAKGLYIVKSGSVTIKITKK